MIKKVALICSHSFSNPGGVKTHILGLFKEYKKKGIKVKIIAPRRDQSENYGRDVILLGTSLPIKLGGTQSDIDINFNPFAIETLLKKEKFDVLHFHNVSFPSVFQVLSSTASSKTVNVLTFHMNLEGGKLLDILMGFIKMLNSFFQHNIDGIIGVSDFNLDPFKKYKGPKAVIPNGIDLKEFNPRIPKIKKFLDGKINILFLGRLEERKGLLYALKAFKIIQKKFSNLRLIVVGKGPLKENLQLWADKNKLKDVVFEGEVSKNVASYYSTCDIYCGPAIFGESFGIVLLEAMACKKPVVAFANQGYKRVLVGKGARFLARPKDYRTLAKKMELLIKNKKLRKKMGEWGIQESAKYAWPKVADQVLNFYNLALKEKKKREAKK